MYLSNRAMLTQKVTGSFAVRAQYPFRRWNAGALACETLADRTVVFSIFIFLQLVGLAYVTYYIYQLSAWTVALDVVAIARIGVGLRNGELPPLENVAKVLKAERG